MKGGVHSSSGGAGTAGIGRKPGFRRCAGIPHLSTFATSELGEPPFLRRLEVVNKASRHGHEMIFKHEGKVIVNSIKGSSGAIAALVFAFSVTPAIAASPTGSADVIHVNGKIETLDPSGTVAEAIAAKDGRFEAVGTSDAIRKLSGRATREVDLEGRLVVPGLIDAHTHQMETLRSERMTSPVGPLLQALAERILANLDMIDARTPTGHIGHALR